MEILKAAAGPNRVSEFQIDHLNPENRIKKREESIKTNKSPKIIIT